jgi:hypothetical protein
MFVSIYAQGVDFLLCISGLCKYGKTLLGLPQKDSIVNTTAEHFSAAAASISSVYKLHDSVRKDCTIHAELF